VRQPLRIIVDSQGKLECNAYQCFSDGYPIRRVTLKEYQNGDDDPFQLVVGRCDKHVDLNELMLKLGDMQLNEVLVEAGPTLAGALLNSGEVDELVCYQAPVILGDKGRSMLTMPKYTSICDAPTLSLLESRQVGRDVRLHFKINK
jgi:diaminohydroxyphosphoribosylaminopyrimidine deaminase/5-amino-6-(5-phosphoribosylamino)uracil reductase